MLKQVFIIYLVVINIFGFLSMGWDKRKSKKGKWRISETRLFVIAIIGGALGSTMGMYVFHHKTKKWKFKVGFPLLTFLVLTVLLFLTTLS